jgi:hypothetical protein
MIDDLMQQIMDYQQMNIEDKRAWLVRLERARKLVTDVLEDSIPRGTNNRDKRGLINLGGHFAKWMFGTATDEDVQKLRAIIEETRGNQEQIVHHIGELITVVNHTQAEAAKNRDYIWDQHAASKKLHHFQYFHAAAINFRDHIAKIRQTFDIHRLIDIIERSAEDPNRANNLYNKKKLWN